MKNDSLPKIKATVPVPSMMKTGVAAAASIASIEFVILARDKEELELVWNDLLPHAGVLDASRIRELALVQMKDVKR